MRATKGDDPTDTATSVDDVRVCGGAPVLNVIVAVNSTRNRYDVLAANVPAATTRVDVGFWRAGMLESRAVANGNKSTVALEKVVGRVSTCDHANACLNELMVEATKHEEPKSVMELAVNVQACDGNTDWLLDPDNVMGNTGVLLLVTVALPTLEAL